MKNLFVGTFSILSGILLFASSGYAMGHGEKGEHGEKDHHKIEISEEQKLQRKTSYEDAVKNNDFEAFDQLRKDKHEFMKEMYDEHCKSQSEEHKACSIKEKVEGNEKIVEKRDAFEEKMFDKAVSHYQETGEIKEPKMKKRFEKKMRTHFKKEHQGIVQKAVMASNMSPERAEKILTKIENKITSVQESEMDEEGKERIIDLLEGIGESIESVLLGDESE